MSGWQAGFDPERGVFVTGTDTGVGKTVVAAAWLCQWRAAGVDAAPMKPVQTGCVGRGSALRAPDLEVCLDSAGMKAAPAEYARMAPYRYRPACSPHLAARMAGETISLRRIRSAALALLRNHERLVVEGAGGVMAPIGGGRTMLDIMTMFGFPVVVVARPGLGTLNHTLLTLDALRGRGLPVAGIVINQAQPGKMGFIEKDNIRTLGRLGRSPILACIPFGGTRKGLSPRVFPAGAGPERRWWRVGRAARIEGAGAQ